MMTAELSMTQLAALEDRMREACNSYVPPARISPDEIIDSVRRKTNLMSRFTMLALEAFEENGYSTEDAFGYIMSARRDIRKETERNVPQGVDSSTLLP